jgi:hypothetical protein
LYKLAEAHLKDPTRYKYADLMRAIQVIVSWLKTEHAIDVTFVKVQGHQLRHIHYDQLTHLEQLNEMMDSCMKAWVDHIFCPKHTATTNDD